MNTWIELAGQPLVHRLGWVLLHFLWQGTVIAAVWTILRSLLRAHEARTRYAVGCLLFALMAVSPFITFMAVRTPDAAGPTVVNALADSGSPLPGSVTASPVYHSLAIPAVTEDFAVLLERSLPSLVTVWCFGVCLLSVRLLRGYWAIQSVRSQHIRPMDQAWLERLVELQRRLSMSRPVLLFESALIQVPVVIGWLRPMILIPASSLSGLTPQQLELILAHELAHIRRHDHWVNLLQVLIETLLFYHPAVWWISRDIRAERELCCDDLAVATCGNRLAYARALTTLETLRHQPAAMALGAGGGSLIERVRHIVGLSASSVTGWRRPIGSALMGLGTLLFAAGVGCIALSPRQYAAVCRVARVEADRYHQEIDSASTPVPSSTSDPYLIALEFEKIRSRAVLYPVIEELGLRERWGQSHSGGAALTQTEAYELLKRKINLRQVPNLNLIEIRLYSDAREQPASEAAEIANKIAEVYRANHVEWTNDSHQRGIKALDQELLEQNEAVKQAQMVVDKLKQENGISDYGVEGAIPALLEPETVRRLEAERVPLQASFEGISQLYKQLNELREKDPRELREAILSANPDLELGKLLQDLWSTEVTLAKMRVSVGTEHPDFRAMSAMQAELDRKVEDRIEGILTGLSVRVNALKAQLESMDKAVATAKDREAETTALYRDYFMAKRDLENKQKIRDAILLRKLQETVDLKIPRSRWNWAIIDPAEPSLQPVRTRVGLGIGLCAAGLATGLCGLVVRGSARPPKL